MLRRIVSKVQFLSESGSRVTFEEPDAAAVAQKKQEFVDRTASQIAVLEIAKDSEAWFKFAMDEPANAGSNRIEVHFYDIYVLAEDLRGFSKSVKVIEPVELAQIARHGPLRPFFDLGQEGHHITIREQPLLACECHAV